MAGMMRGCFRERPLIYPTGREGAKWGGVSPAGSEFIPPLQQDEGAGAMPSVPCPGPHDKKHLQCGHYNSENVWQPT